MFERSVNSVVKRTTAIVFGLLLIAACNPSAETAPPAGQQSNTAVVATDVQSSTSSRTPGPRPTYQAARWDPIHFKPGIDHASDQQCLVCHREVIDDRPLSHAPAGVEADATLAWYQTLDTYEGAQETLHRRHLITPFARRVMNLRCNTCHQGNDPREETSGSSATTQVGLTMRKQVDPKVCLMCHGSFNFRVMGIPGPWTQQEPVFKTCMGCHAAVRTERHKVNFLNASEIEKAGQESSDACFGCHGGRAWYRIPYPYPRHPWPGGAPEIPAWAQDRPTASEPRFLERTEAQLREKR